jgi:phosphoenolpyruvate carboxylase
MSRSNPYEAAARLTKATKLANLLNANGISAADAADMTQAQWVTVAGVAEVIPPSVATREVVLRIMRSIESLRRPVEMSDDELFARMSD